MTENEAFTAYVSMRAILKDSGFWDRLQALEHAFYNEEALAIRIFKKDSNEIDFSLNIPQSSELIRRTDSVSFYWDEKQKKVDVTRDYIMGR